ncbi:hypothetical protein F4777DRAFT_582141 [Nemania sp. FL0916]|nr:hypothetical protein F4777DRAFT_582141 [Nemania sp. FL0916]
MGRILYGLVLLSCGVVCAITYRRLTAKTEQLPKPKDHARSRQPLEILYSSPTNGTDDGPEVDIIAVHGLGSEVDWSWTWKNNGGEKVHWLRDSNMLPAKLPKSRIIVYNYDSKWHKDAPKTRLELCGEDLIHSVHSFRSDTPNRPIIFYLLANDDVEALLYARREARYNSLLDHVVGLVFLGTPFRGTKWQLFLNALTQIMLPASSHDGIVRELKFDDSRLADKLHYFCRLINKVSMPVACFFELYETDYGSRNGITGVARGIVVKESSACIPGHERFGLEKDHLKINKYFGPTDRSYILVSDVLLTMYSNAKDVILRRQNPSEIITDRNYALKKLPEAGPCLRDLYLTDPSEDKDSLKRRKGKRASGTCEWILGTEQLTTWLRPAQPAGVKSQTPQLLWLYGNPGTGKSTMAIFLAEELSQDFSKTSGKTVAYFFCDSGFDKRATATSVVRGLLLQLVQQHPQLLNYVLPKYEERGAELFTSFDAIWKIFMAAVADKATGEKYCIIDALDECDEESQDTLLQQIEETFHARDAAPNLHVLITSRPYQKINEYLKQFSNKNLASFAERKHDIDRFIEERVNALADKKKYPERTKRQVLEILTEKAEGTFLWASLACQELKDVPSKDAVQILQDIPQGLHSLYRKLLDTAVTRKGATASNIKRILSLVIACEEPLSLLELSEACELHHMEEDTDTIQFMQEEVDSCRLLINIHDEKVFLLHQSVKDFLINPHAGRIDVRKAHATLAFRSIDVLLEQSHNSTPGSIFKRYATLHWADHARMAEDEFEIKDSQAEFFALNSPSRERWRETLRDYQDIHGILFRGVFSAHHVASLWGIIPLLNYLGCPSALDRGSGVFCSDTRDNRRLTPIALAAWTGHLRIIPMILDLDWHTIDQALLVAAESASNAVEFMTLLLDRQDDQIPIADEVVVAAAGNHYYSTELMALLLNRRGDRITITYWVIKTAAQFMRGAEIMARLLERREDQVAILKAVMVAAAKNKHGAEIMALLLERGGDHAVITNAVMVAAAKNKHGAEIMAVLLERGGDRAVITNAVIVAAAGNNYGAEIMELLLERREDQVVITNKVIVAAAENRYHGAKMIALLLKWKEDSVVITEEVIAAAAKNTFGAEIIALLLKGKEDQVVITEEMIAAAKGSFHGEEIMALLLTPNKGRLLLLNM